DGIRDATVTGVQTCALRNCGGASVSLSQPRHLSTAIAAAGGLHAALRSHAIPEIVTIPLAEALVLGLIKQGVRKFLAIFGHGSTTLAETLRVYEAAGLTRTWQFRNEVSMAHAATQLSWQYDEIPA